MLSNPKVRAVVFFLLAGAVGSGVAAVVGHAEFFETVERKSYDWRSREFRHDVSEPTSALVLVDETTLAFLKKHENIGWPLPRDMYCPVILWLAKSGAKVTAFDILYSDPTEFDAIFAECIREAGNVVLAFQCHKGSEDPNPPKNWSWQMDALPGAKTGQLCDPVLPAVEEGAELTLRTAPKTGALVTVQPDHDGVLRHMTPMVRGKEGYHAVLGMGAYLAQQATPVVSHHGEYLQVDNHRIPLDENGQVVVRWRPNWPPFPIYSFSQIYSTAKIEEAEAEGPVPDEIKKTKLDPALFKGKTIFLGTSAAGTYETRVSPIREKDYGIHLHASLFESIVSDDYNERADGTTNMLLLLFSSFLMAAVATIPKKVSSEIIFSTFVYVAFIGIVVYAFESQGLWLDVVAPTMGMIMAFSTGIISNYLTEGRQKSQIRSAFSMYLSPIVIESLVEDPTKLKLGGERRQITAFFSDVAGFTSFSERMEPQELVAFLNVYLTEMTEIILSEGGTIDKYEGDAIIAMFGAPVIQQDHAYRACRAAIRCQNRLAELRPQWIKEGLPECRMRIGVNSGDAVVGNMGSTQRFDYTMMGDTVNLAARLEGTNKVYGTELMCGEITHELCGDRILMRELDSVRVKGKKLPVRVFEPLADVAESNDEQRRYKESWEGCLLLYREQRFTEAHAKLNEHLRAFRHDNCAKEFLDRCSAFEAFPPASDWDGVYEMKTK